MKSVKKITKRTDIATAIAPVTVLSNKKSKISQQEPAAKKKQVNPATLPPLIKTVDMSTLKPRMLATVETVKARAVYEEFVNSLDLAEYPGKFDQASFGDMLNVTPSLPTNKRKLDSLLNVDERVASVYQDAQEIYKSLLDKTENAKINDFAKRKKLAQKKPTSKKENASAEPEVAEQVPALESVVEQQPAAEVPAAVAEPATVVQDVATVATTEVATETATT